MAILRSKSPDDLAAWSADLDHARERWQGRQAVQAWGSFAQKLQDYAGKWDWFITLTFLQRIHPESAIKCWNTWFRWLESKAVDEPLQGKGYGPWFIRAIELQKRDVIHFHALMGGVNAFVRRTEAEQYWKFHDLRCGFASIFPYDSTKGAQYYICKYVLKGGQVDIHVPPSVTERLREDYGQDWMAWRHEMKL